MAAPWDRRQKSSGSRGFRSKPRRRNDCIKYRLQGECELGDRCKFAHDVKLEPDRVYTAYAAMPEKLPIGLAVGRKAGNLRRIMNAVGCLLIRSERSEREVKILAADRTQLSRAEGKLKVLFSQLYPMSPSCCYLHTEGIQEIIDGNLLLEFRKYEGRTPKHVAGEYQSAMYEICCCEVTKAKAEHDTSLEKLEELNPTTPTSPLDSKDYLHSELDRIVPGASVSTPEPTPCLADKAAKTIGPSTRVRIMVEYKDDIKQHLQGALEWVLKNRDQTVMDRRMVKLEARFGKLLYFHLAEDVLAAQPWGVDKFAKFIFNDINYTQLFNTEVKKANVEGLRAEIADIADAQPMLETFDIKMTAGQDHQKLDLRLKIEGGKPQAILVKWNETKVVVSDLLCLNRQHDIRIAVSCLEIFPPTNGVVPQLMKTLTFSEPGTLTLVPCADDWTVEFIRHKKRTAYVIDDKYIVTVGAIQEYRTEWEKLPKWESITVKFEGNPEIIEHFEVEFHNIMWECTFGKDVGFTPEKALALHTEHPAVTPQLAASIPHPWGVQDILQDYDEFLDYLDQLNESLGMVVA